MHINLIFWNSWSQQEKNKEFVSRELFMNSVTNICVFFPNMIWQPTEACGCKIPNLNLEWKVLKIRSKISRKLYNHGSR